MFFRPKLDPITLSVLKSVIDNYFCWSFLVFLLSFLFLGYFLEQYASVHEIEHKDMTNLFLTYNALVLSFSLSSITLVIALPSHEFVSFLAQDREVKKNKMIPLKNLILSFFQVAHAHYVSLTLLLLFFIFGPEKISINSLISTGDWASIIFLIQAWAFFLFGWALKDIASLGVLYSTYLATINAPKVRTDPSRPT